MQHLQHLVGAPVPSLEAFCRSLAPRLPPGAAFSHWTALRLVAADLSGLDVDDAVHVTVPPGSRPPRRRGVVGHAAQAAGADEVRGLLVVPPGRAWTSLAPLLGVERLALVGDALTRDGAELLGLEDLRAAVAAIPPGTRGARTAREAVRRVLPHGCCALQSRARLLLSRGAVPPPGLVRPPVPGPRARPLIGWPGQRLVLECDDSQHPADELLRLFARTRRERLAAAGWTVLSVLPSDREQRGQPLLRRVVPLLRPPRDPFLHPWER